MSDGVPYPTYRAGRYIGISSSHPTGYDSLDVGLAFGPQGGFGGNYSKHLGNIGWLSWR